MSKVSKIKGRLRRCGLECGVDCREPSVLACVEAGYAIFNQPGTWSRWRGTHYFCVRSMLESIPLNLNMLSSSGLVCSESCEGFPDDNSRLGSLSTYNAAELTSTISRTTPG